MNSCASKFWATWRPSIQTYHTDTSSLYKWKKRHQISVFVLVTWINIYWQSYWGISEFEAVPSPLKLMGWVTNFFKINKDTACLFWNTQLSKAFQNGVWPHVSCFEICVQPEKRRQCIEREALISSVFLRTAKEKLFSHFFLHFKSNPSTFFQLLHEPLLTRWPTYI